MEVLWVFSHSNPVAAVAWGKRAIVCATMDAQGYVWSDTGSQMKAHFRLGMVHPKVVRVIPSGGKIAFGGSSMEVFTLSGRLLFRFKNSSFTNDLVWLTDGRILAVQNKGLVLWNPTTGETEEVKNPRGCAFSSVAVDPKGGRFVTGTCDGSVDVWFLDTLIPYKTFKFSSPIVDLAWSLDGKLFIATDESIYIYSSETWRRIGAIDRGTYGIKFISVSYNGRFVIYGGQDKTPRLYDLERNVIYEGPPFFHWVMDGDWEDSGFRFVMVGADGQGRVFRVKPEYLGR